jgi:hypothetical protein
MHFDNFFGYRPLVRTCALGIVLIGCSSGTHPLKPDANSSSLQTYYGKNSKGESYFFEVPSRFKLLRADGSISFQSDDDEILEYNFIAKTPESVKAIDRASAEHTHNIVLEGGARASSLVIPRKAARRPAWTATGSWWSGDATATVMLKTFGRLVDVEREIKELSSAFHHYPSEAEDKAQIKSRKAVVIGG